MITKQADLTQCPYCEYDIHLGIADARCPECGLHLDRCTFVFRPSNPIRLLLRQVLLPLTLLFILLPAAATLLVIIIPAAIANAIVLLLLVATFAGLIVSILRARRDAPILVTSSAGVSVRRSGQVEFAAWNDVDLINLTDLPPRVKTVSRRVISLSQCFQNRTEKTTFGEIAQLLKSAGSAGPRPTEDELYDALIDRLNSTAPPVRSTGTGWILTCAGYLAGTILLGLIVGRFHRNAGLGVSVGLFWIGVILLLVRIWRSERVKNPGESTV